MQNGSERQASQEAPLYIRWNPDRTPYAIELRLDLVEEVAAELERAVKAGIEIGGLLIGSLPSDYSATLRIEEFQPIPQGAEEGAVYVLEPAQQEQLARARARARMRQREAVGFFRTHLRSGEMRPSLADRTLLASEFRDSVYVVLLIEGREPHNATFFLAANGTLAGEPSVRSFRFDEREFRALPEVPAEVTAFPATEPTGERKPRSGVKVYGTVAVLLAIAIAACFLMWSFSRQTPLPHIAGEANPLNLAVSSRGPYLRVTWDHAAHELDHASGATMLIVEGANRRELQLGIDELRLGAVEYEHSGAVVQVTLKVNAPGSAPSNQTVYWVQR